MFDLREEEVSVLVTRQHVVHQNRRPRAVFAQTHLIGSFCTQRASHHHLLHQLGTFSQDSQGTQEPVLQNMQTGRNTVELFVAANMSALTALQCVTLKIQIYTVFLSISSVF